MEEQKNEERPQPAKLFSVPFVPPRSDHEKKAPIILVHGVLATNATWNPIRQPLGLKTKRKVIALDIRNHGRSEWPTDTFTLEAAINDLENFALQQNISKAIWMGHSFGGRIALGLALKRPDLVEKLILEDTFLEVDEKMMTLTGNLFGLVDVIKKLPKSLTEEEGHNMVIKQFRDMWPEETDNFMKNQAVVPPFYKDRKTGEFKVNVDEKCKDNLGELNFDLSSNPTYEGKTLLLTAETTNYINSNDTKDLQKLVPNSRAVVIQGGTHCLHIENTPQVIDVVTKFINEE